MKKVLALALTISLAGCAGLSIQNPISTTTLAQAESTYGIALSAAVAYRNSCAQKLIPSTCRATVQKIQVYGASAQSAMLKARNFVRANPTLDPSAMISAASITVEAFRDIIPPSGS